MSEFQWKTQDGEILKPAEMETTHLFYVIRTIWNHTAPPYMRLPGGRWKGFAQMPVLERKRILRSMAAELAKRDDLPFALDVQLGIMRDRCREFAGENLLGE